MIIVSRIWEVRVNCKYQKILSINYTLMPHPNHIIMSDSRNLTDPNNLSRQNDT